jgi:hypothetical protein
MSCALSAQLNRQRLFARVETLISAVYLSLDAEGPHWLICDDLPANDPSHRVRVDLVRGETVTLRNRVDETERNDGAPLPYAPRLPNSAK